MRRHWRTLPQVQNRGQSQLKGSLAICYWDRGCFPRLCFVAMEAAGIDAAAVFAAVGLGVEQLKSRDLTYPHESCIEFWQHAERSSGDADVGLTVGRYMPSYRGEVLEYLYRSSPDFGTGLQRGMRYSRLLSDGMEGRIDADAHGAFVAGRSRLAAYNACRHQAECYALGMLRFFRDVTDRAFVPRRVELTCDPPADTALREKVFGCPVRFGAAEARIYFAPELLDHVSADAEDELFRLHDRIASERVQRIVARDFVTTVRRTIGSLLEQGDASLGRVAARLRLKPAEVREGLAAAGASFGQELDGYRHRLACRLLAATEYAIQDVSYLTGFSEPATFYRAFRRWEDETPASYRKRHQPAL